MKDSAQQHIEDLLQGSRHMPDADTIGTWIFSLYVSMGGNFRSVDLPLDKVYLLRLPSWHCALKQCLTWATPFTDLLDDLEPDLYLGYTLKSWLVLKNDIDDDRHCRRSGLLSETLQPFLKALITNATHRHNTSVIHKCLDIIWDRHRLRGTMVWDYLMYLELVEHDLQSVLRLISATGIDLDVFFQKEYELLLKESWMKAPASQGYLWNLRPPRGRPHALSSSYPSFHGIEDPLPLLHLRRLPSDDLTLELDWFIDPSSRIVESTQAFPFVGFSSHHRFLELLLFDALIQEWVLQSRENLDRYVNPYAWPYTLEPWMCYGDSYEAKHKLFEARFERRWVKKQEKQAKINGTWRKPSRRMPCQWIA
jgi:hypothetical protein